MRLPIGYDDFGKIAERQLDLVDKTLFIKDLFDDPAEVIVITRPRRFGKTLLLSTLHYFLAANVRGQNTQGMFDLFNIAQCGDYYFQQQGKYPVISLTLKSIKETSYEKAFQKLALQIKNLYTEFRFLLESGLLQEQERQYFEDILWERASEIHLQASLVNLCDYINRFYGVKPWLLLDEYDTPIQSAYLYGYYDEMINFMRGFLGEALKNNPYLYRAVITGILRVAKESLFSGVNNLRIYTLFSQKYSEYFGFTEVEVTDILDKTHLHVKLPEIKAWYNGYQIGNTVIYNPWSIVNCVNDEGMMKPYWINTSDNQLIKDILKKAPLDFKQKFEALLSGQTIEKVISEDLVFGELLNSPYAAWSLLLMSGYLKPLKGTVVTQGTLCELAIPNKEVNNLFCGIIEAWLADGHDYEWYRKFLDSLLTGDMLEFKRHLDKVLIQIISYHDFATEPEAFFHGLLLGFIATLQDNYEILSNRESGLGRFDIMLIPNDKSKLGIILELKIKAANETLLEAAEKALKQSEEKRYVAQCYAKHIQQCMKVGLGFEGKLVEMVFESSQSEKS